MIPEGQVRTFGEDTKTKILISLNPNSQGVGHIRPKLVLKQIAMKHIKCKFLKKIRCANHLVRFSSQKTFPLKT
jgi:hypothetical protein